jgi:hypothetical protein
MESAHREPGAGGDLISGPRLAAREFELHRRAPEETVRPIEDAELDQLDRWRRRRRLARHGREYTNRAHLRR